jgi:tRNA nucleotidyltransferase (CCA-adding enzyme)
MHPSAGDIDPGSLPSRLDALGGIERVRAAADGAAVDAYLVGGSVRDLLLGRERVDIDVAVDGDAMALAEALDGEVRPHKRFGTASVSVDGHVFDLAATRAETYPQPGALPEIRPANLAEDLARRDFTVNAMAVPLRGEPELVDPHAGLADLRAGVLRVLHERSLADDPTRALRAARYAARIGLEPEPGTLAQLRGTDLATVSHDRVETELRRLAAEGIPRQGFELLQQWGLFDLAPTTARLIEAVVALCARPEWSRLDHRADAVLAAARGGEGSSRELAASDPAAPSEAVRLARGRDPTDLLLARAQGAAWLDRYLSEWRHVRLEITGRDLIAAGVPEGPAIGRGLAATLDAKLDGAVSGREEELRTALAFARNEAS